MSEIGHFNSGFLNFRVFPWIFGLMGCPYTLVSTSVVQGSIIVIVRIYMASLRPDMLWKDLFNWGKRAGCSIETCRILSCYNAIRLVNQYVFC